MKNHLVETHDQVKSCNKFSNMLAMIFQKILVTMKKVNNDNGDLKKKNKMLIRKSEIDNFLTKKKRGSGFKGKKKELKMKV